MSYIDMVDSVLRMAFFITLISLFGLLFMTVFFRLHNYIWSNYIEKNVELDDLRSKNIYVLAGAPKRFSSRDMYIASRIYDNMGGI